MGLHFFVCAFVAGSCGATVPPCALGVSALLLVLWALANISKASKDPNFFLTAIAYARGNIERKGDAYDRKKTRRKVAILNIVIKVHITCTTE